MRLENGRYRLAVHRRSSWLEAIAGPFAQAVAPDGYPLRFSVVEAAADEIVVEATVVRFADSEPYADRFRSIELLTPRRKTHPASPAAVVQVIPTGIRCEFGGYAGDACPATNLLAAAADLLIAHPNAVNASELNEMASNVLYVEGKSLDDFLLGHVALVPVTANKVGTFIDPTGLEYLDDVLNTLNAARAAKGIDCGLYAVLDEEIGVRIEWSRTGCAAGTVLRPEAILDAVELLIARGAQAAGGVSVIHGVTAEMFARHLAGEIPNPSGGIEAIITHLISKIFRIPTAHAPLPYYQDIKEKSTRNPRASAEFISTPHYFSVLKGLAKAPRIVPAADLWNLPPHFISLNNVIAIVTPASCLGGIPALAAEFNDIPLIAVRENQTILDITNARMRMPNAIEVESYLEAAGVILALREGIALESLRRPLAGPLRVARPAREEAPPVEAAAT
ncbi:MAG: DUF3326 domain-containing protein [Bryobacteraceae bacterium]|nr:DUF3326 domain-containing protein [Bryobacteraceae bacterium]